MSEESQSQTYTVFRNVTDEAVALLTSKEMDKTILLKNRWTLKSGRASFFSGSSSNQLTFIFYLLSFIF
jgi:hypothetical protein